MMSFRQWDKEHGRRVGKKGESGAIWILAPRTRRVEEEAADGSKISTYRHRVHRGPGLQHHAARGPRPEAARLCAPRCPYRTQPDAWPPPGNTDREEQLPGRTALYRYWDPRLHRPCWKVIVVDS